MSGPDFTAYAQARAALVAQLREKLAADERFAAAWLYGSLGRGDGDQLSDIDLALVVVDRFAGELCQRPWEIGAGAPPARLDLFRRFGEPILIHENHVNAKPGGSFSYVRYRENGLMIDWSLRPLAGAARPADTLLLFDKAGIPLLLPPAQSAPDGVDEVRLAERSAFFWMMAGVTAKYLSRGDASFGLAWVGRLLEIVEEVETLRGLDSEPGDLPLPGPAVHLGDTLRLLCARMARCAAVDSAVREQIESWIP
jgi:hypothetical protein